MDRKGPLDADPERVLADRKRLARARALALDDDALEDLHAAPLTLDHLEVDAHGVPRLELRDVLAQLTALDDVDRSSHRESPGGEGPDRDASETRFSAEASRRRTRARSNCSAAPVPSRDCRMTTCGCRPS